MLQSDCCGNTRKQFQHNKSKTKWNTLKLLPKTMETVSKNKIKRWDYKAQQKKHCGNKAQQKTLCSKTRRKQSGNTLKTVLFLLHATMWLQHYCLCRLCMWSEFFAKGVPYIKSSIFLLLFFIIHLCTVLQTIIIMPIIYYTRGI